MLQHSPSHTASALAWYARPATLVGVAVLLAVLGMANVLTRAWVHDVEDGVRWDDRPTGVTVAEVDPTGPAARAGLRSGDVLLAVDQQPVTSKAEVLGRLQQAQPGERHHYTVARLGTHTVADVQWSALPNAAGPLYFLLASVGLLALLVGTTVQGRRPHDPATRHFFWLCVTFFGVLTFSFSGRLDPMDWFFYSADTLAWLLLPPALLHFVWVFPERPPGRQVAMTRSMVLACYVPAMMLGLARIGLLAAGSWQAPLALDGLRWLDRTEMALAVAYFVAAAAVLWRAQHAMVSPVARRQRQWMLTGTVLAAVPFGLGYGVPQVLGIEPPRVMALTALLLGMFPVAAAAALVHYRLADIEVLLKRALVLLAVAAAGLGVFLALLRAAGPSGFESEFDQRWTIAFLATLVLLLVARPVTEGLQQAVDRAFYRGRYDYRRALVAFARDLAADLDVERLAMRLTDRVIRTLEVDGMAVLLVDPEAGVRSVHRQGHMADLPPLTMGDVVLQRLEAGQVVRPDDPSLAGSIEAHTLVAWRQAGVSVIVPCRAGRVLVGLLVIGWRSAHEAVTSDDVRLLMAVASQIAVAMQNGRLFGQLQRKALELDRLRAFNEDILESLEHGLIVTDGDGRVTRWNRAMVALYGVTAAEAVGQLLTATADPSLLALVEQLRTRPDPLAVTLRATIQRRSPHGTSSTRLVNITRLPVQRPDGGTADGDMFIVEDLTHRTQLEEQLRLSEKMASLGVLAAGVAHEVNTPLTGISSYTQLLMEQMPDGSPERRMLEKIETQAFRAARIVNGLLHLSRSAPVDDAERRIVDLNAVVGDVMALLEPQLEKARIRVRSDLQPGTLPVLGFESKLQQVFLNLFINARDAMPRGGWLSVTTRGDGADAVVEVADTGTGISPDVLERIYDPFFTTKPMGQGTGLGLAITYGIVREHDAAIQCQSAPGQGTQFTVRFAQAGRRDHPAAV